MNLQQLACVAGVALMGVSIPLSANAQSMVGTVNVGGSSGGSTDGSITGISNTSGATGTSSVPTSVSNGTNTASTTTPDTVATNGTTVSTGGTGTVNTAVSTGANTTVSTNGTTTTTGTSSDDLANVVDPNLDQDDNVLTQSFSASTAGRSIERVVSQLQRAVTQQAKANCNTLGTAIAADRGVRRVRMTSRIDTLTLTAGASADTFVGNAQANITCVERTSGRN